LKLESRSNEMTGHELRSLRLNAGLLARMLADRLGVSMSAVCNAENRGRKTIHGNAIRAALADCPDAFFPYDSDRDGPRSRMPNRYTRGTAPKTSDTAPEPPADAPEEAPPEGDTTPEEATRRLLTETIGVLAKKVANAGTPGTAADLSLAAERLARAWDHLGDEAE
jgi:transcriptional regulator with XRE-family HTH domain